MTSEPGSFAQGTIAERKPQIIRQVIEDNGAMVKDVRATMALLQATVPELGARLASYLEMGWLILKDDPFWTSYLMFRHLPPALRADLTRADLLVLKGDVNYRRLLDDRHWPHTARLEEIAAYFPAPFLVLRTLKGEIMVGLGPGQVEALVAEDPTWLINGRRGIVQLVAALDGSSKSS